MSEKIYACLLRLYPPAFRRRYQKEALQLLGDRLREERGFFRRLRLTFDLVVDTIGALPQAYRNSYAEVAAVASVTPPLDAIPSFQSLQNEPIRRGAFVTAGVVTLTVPATFGYVMELPIPHAQPSGPKSPIETVLEHLNKPTSSDSADNFRSENPQSAVTTVSRPENRPSSRTDAAVPPRVKFLPNADGQALELSGQSSNARTFDHAASHPPAALSSPVSGDRQSVRGQPEAVPVVARSVNPSEIQVAPATSLSGKWTANADADTPQLFLFNQHSAVLSGTGGPDSTDQYPINHGSVAGDSVRFELNHERKSFLYDLKLEGEKLRGTLTIRIANETWTAAVRLERAH